MDPILPNEPHDCPLSDDEADALIRMLREQYAPELLNRPPLDFESLLAAARRRLVELLAPRTEQERALVDQLGQTLDLQALLVLTELIGYGRER